MAKTKKKQKELCNFLVQVPRQLRLAFKKECYKQRRSAKAAIEMFMEAVISKQLTFGNGLKIKKKKK